MIEGAETGKVSSAYIFYLKKLIVLKRSQSIITSAF